MDRPSMSVRMVREELAREAGELKSAARADDGVAGASAQEAIAKLQEETQFSSGNVLGKKRSATGPLHGRYSGV